MKRKTVKKLSKRILNLTAKIIASERWIEGVRGQWRGPTGCVLRLICPMAYNVSEHNIFNSLFFIEYQAHSSQFRKFNIRSTVSCSGRIRIIFSPREKGLSWIRLNFLIPSATACTRNWIGSIDRGLSILNYRYTDRNWVARSHQRVGSSFAAHKYSVRNPRAALLRIIVGECRLASKEGRLQKVLFKADKPIAERRSLD